MGRSNDYSISKMKVVFRTFQSLVRNMTKNDSKEDKAEAGHETKKVRPDGQIED